MEVSSKLIFYNENNNILNIAPLWFLLSSFWIFSHTHFFSSIFFIVLFVILFSVVDREWEIEDEETWGAEQEYRVHKLRFPILMGGLACELVLD